MTFRDRIQPQLRDWYDASAGFDFEHLEEFVPKCNAAELANLREDPQVKAWDQMIPGPDGAPQVKIRVYAPSQREKAPLPCLFFYHGGGFLFGTVYRQEDLCQRYVKHVGCVVVSVEYRLAPQWKMPAPLEDCYAALLWVWTNHQTLGVDPDRLAVAGLSAGGNLAAAVALLARDRKGPRLCLQVPLYGELDCRLETPSSQEITDRKVWCRDNCRISWDKVLSPGHMPTQYESPALAKDLGGLPPLFSFIGQLDPGRDENLTYWSRLMAAGVPVECHVFPGCYHCFELSVPEAEVSKQAYELTSPPSGGLFPRDEPPSFPKFPCFCGEKEVSLPMEVPAHLRIRMAKRNLSHAYLVVGENRRPLAEALAAAWVCTGETPPCGHCPGCRKAGLGIHPDIIRADPEGEGLKAEEVRALRSDAYIRPNEAPKKVYLLEHSELLNPTGQNILLKLIEEGPAYACFLFLSPQPGLLLPTIRSRCETLRAPGEETRQADQAGETLADLILTGASPRDRLPFLLSLEKKDREEFPLLLEAALSRLAAELPRRPDLLPVLDRLVPIRAACEFPVSPGHLSGWIAAAL